MVYAMSMNIKNPEAERLARDVARMTGGSLTGAIIDALHQRLRQEERKRKPDDLVERWLAIGRDCASRLKEPERSMDHADLLYDERGLPK
jgi:antitoxin VapB